MKLALGHFGLRTHAKDHLAHAPAHSTAAMASLVSEQAIRRLQPHLQDGDAEWLGPLITYFDRNSLWLNQIQPGPPLCLRFANEAEGLTLQFGAA